MGILDGKVILVTGASGGLGGAVVEALVAAGAEVVAAARHAPTVPGAIAPRVRALAGDLVDEAGAQRLVEEAAAWRGRLDGLANLVGAWLGGAPVAATPTDTWRRMLSVNLDAAFFVTRAALGPMLRAKSGRVVHVGSRAAVEPQPGSAAYAVAKAGLVALVRTVAEEVRGAGVTVNCVLPGTIDTPANRASMPGADASRWVPPREIAEAIAWLLSDGAAGVTGAALPLYGR